MVVSVIHIASDPVAQFYACAYVRVCVRVCGGDPDARGVEHGATTSWVSKPSLAHESIHASC